MLEFLWSYIVYLTGFIQSNFQAILDVVLTGATVWVAFATMKAAKAAEFAMKEQLKANIPYLELDRLSVSRTVNSAPYNHALKKRIIYEQEITFRIDNVSSASVWLKKIVCIITPETKIKNGENYVEKKYENHETVKTITEITNGNLECSYYHRCKVVPGSFYGTTIMYHVSDMPLFAKVEFKVELITGRVFTWEPVELPIPEKVEPVN